MKGNRVNHPRAIREPKFCEVCNEPLFIRDTYEQKHKRFHHECLPEARKRKLIDFNNKKIKEIQ